MNCHGFPLIHEVSVIKILTGQTYLVYVTKSFRQCLGRHYLGWGENVGENSYDSSRLRSASIDLISPDTQVTTIDR